MNDAGTLRVLAKAINQTRRLLAIGDNDEAYHILYTAADTLSDDPFEPWKEIDRLSSEDTT